MKTIKKILLLSGVALLASCGNGTPIEPAAANERLVKIQETLLSETYEAPEKVKMTSELSEENGVEKNSAKTVVAYANDYIYASVSNELGTDKSTTEVWVYVEGSTVYAVMDDHNEVKGYGKIELGSPEEASETFALTAAQYGYGEKTQVLMSGLEIMLPLTQSVILIAQDIEGYLESEGLTSDKVSYDIELASKNEGHLYAGFELKYTLEDGDDKCTEEIVMNSEFENYLPKSLDYSIVETETFMEDGKKVTEKESMSLKASFEYDFRMSKPDLSKFQLME